MTSDNVIVFGHKEHGKDAVCEYLEHRYGVSFSGSSWYACKTFLFDQIKEEFGYATPEECYADRRNHRQLWYEAIRDYNKDDRAKMGKEIFCESTIYCGIRDREEFEALKDQGAFSAAIWIDSSKRLPPESSESMNLSIFDSDFIVDNNRVLADLHRELDALADKMGWYARDR